MEGSWCLQRTAVTDGDASGDSGDGGVAAPVVGEEGEVDGAVRRSEGVVGVVLVELGGDCGDRGNGSGSLVSCNSGERWSSSGAMAPVVPGR